ncbi:MAG: hypothetical protein JXA98_07295 [Methanosarcinaceae archaeon]|nr:hypothetical protein [Methanosarcinaceae archaeon]
MKTTGSRTMKVDEYVDMFFKTAKEMGYTLETCKRGKASGQPQINFGNEPISKV